jgi:glycerol-3-phosphate acyltransferase PlsY
MADAGSMVVILLAGYLIGSISFAVLISRAKGVDIFTVGSGNPGATNVMRALGKPAGYSCFVLDALKGSLAALAGMGLALRMGTDPFLTGTFGLVGAILGHSFSIFLRFRGGKGVATTVGGLFVLMPWVLIAGAAVWIVMYLVFRYVSLASLLLGASLPITAVLMKNGPYQITLCGLIALLIFVRHRSNIKRLINGTENRAGPMKS